MHSKNKQHEVNELLMQNKPDIMLISEVNMKNKQQYLFKGYKLIYSPMKEKGRGTAIIIRANIEYEIIALNNTETLDCCVVYK